MLSVRFGSAPSRVPQKMTVQKILSREEGIRSAG